jgi:hypothetical protein
MNRFLVLALLALSSCGGATPPAKPPAPTTGSPFTAQPIEGLGDPEVVIENRSDVPFTVALTGAAATTLEVPPHEKRSVRVKPGSYTYKASSPEILPAEGAHEFVKDMRYLWAFFIVKKHADDPEYAGKGWHCFDVKTKPLPYYVCTREKSHCEKLHAEPAKPGDPPIGDCAPQTVVFGFVDSARDIAIYALDGATCGQLRTSYLQQVTDATKVTGCTEKP